jgi:hypothetical protein
MHLSIIFLIVYSGLCLFSCGQKKQLKPWIFQATYDSGVGGCSLVFRKDSTVLWIGGIASNDKEGYYHIKDSLIILEKIPIETCLKSKYLLITNRNPNQSETGDTILVQVDQDLHIVDSTYIFQIYRPKSSD